MRHPLFAALVLAALPAGAMPERTAGGASLWRFSLPPGGPEPLLRALIEGEAGILSLSIERGGLHDAFVAIAGAAAAKALNEPTALENGR